jgi:hypothetical protein
MVDILSIATYDDGRGSQIWPALRVSKHERLDEGRPFGATT